MALYGMTFHIGRGRNADMRATWVGAYVPVFVFADNENDAIRRCGEYLLAKGFDIRHIQGKIIRIDVTDWDTFVATTWPDFVSRLPRRAELDAYREGKAFCGPYAGYDQPASNDAPQARQP